METRSELTVEFTLQPSDVYDPFLWSRRNLARWIMTLFACFVIYDSRRFWFPAASGAATESALLLLSSLGVLALVVLFFVPWLRVRSMFRKFPVIGKPRRISFSSEGMHLESEDAQGDYKWSLFGRIVETPKFFVFMQTAYSGTYVPRRCLSKPDAILILRQLIRENFKGERTLRRD